jgi:hypothetical protein
VIRQKVNSPTTAILHSITLASQFSTKAERTLSTTERSFMADNKPEGWETKNPALMACNRATINSPPPDLRDCRVAPASHRIEPSAIIRNGASLSGLDAAAIHLTIAVQAWRLGIQDTFHTAIEALKNVDAKDFAKALAEWVRQNTKTVSVIACVLVPLMCAGLALPILGAIGFGSGGIVAGRHTVHRSR